MVKEYFVYSSTKAKFAAQVANGTVDATQIGIIGDTAEVWINGVYRPIAPLLDYAKRSEVAAGYLPKNALSVEPSEHNFTWRVATGDSKLTDSLAVVNKLLGRTVKWNQLIDRCVSVTDSASQVTVRYNSSNEIVINNTSPKSSDYSQVATFGVVSSKTLTKDHKYLICADRAHLGVGITEGTYSTSFHHVNSVFSANYNIVPLFAISPSYDFSVEHSYSADGSVVRRPTVPMKLNLFDLTEMFGSGNEPKSLGEFRKLYPKAYYEPCTTPQTVGVKIEALPSASYNLWNKDEAVQGAIHTNGPINGWLSSNSYYQQWCTYIIPVVPNTRYYLLKVANRAQCMPCVYYDADMNYITYGGPQNHVHSADYTSGEVLTPANAAYMAVMVKNTHKDDACVSVSSRRNGDYESYIASGAPLDAISELTDADGNKVFPHGLLATADGVADEVGDGYALQRVTYDTAADGTISNLRQVQIVNSAGNTVLGYYYYPIDTRLWMTWRVRRGATEKVTLSDVSAPFRASISYALDVNDLLSAPLLEDVGGGTILTYNDLTRTPFRSTKTISQNWTSIRDERQGMIPTCQDVFYAIQRLRPAAVAPAMPKQTVSSTTIHLIANTVVEYSISASVSRYMIASISKNVTDPNAYDDYWIFRGSVNAGTTFAYQSNMFVIWKDGIAPQFTKAGYVEIRLREFGDNNLFLGEWIFYPL